MATDAPPTRPTGARIPRRFTRPVHPYDEIAWGPREAVIVEPARDDRPEREVFRQDDCEFPLDWSDTAVRIVASKYFRYGMDDPRRERSLRQVIDRVVDTIRHHGAAGGYFADDDEAETFAQELRHILVTQKAAFNSPVWFNCGVGSRRARRTPTASWTWTTRRSARASRRSTRPPRASSCRSTTRCRPSSAGSPRSRRSSAAGRARANLSRLRGDGEPLSNGGQASGPVSFMRWADSGAGSIKSGGGTRRAAKMVILDADHPDILEFVRSKAHEEQKAYALGEMGYDLGLNGDAWRSIQFQNANNSVRLTDDFFRRVEQGESWQTRAVASGEVARCRRPSCWPRSPGRLGLRRPRRPVRGHHPALAHLSQRRADLGLKSLLGISAHRRLGLQSGVDQPHGVPRRRRRVRGRRLPPRRARDAHRAGDHRHAGQLPDQADRRQRARLPPARARLHQPRLAADVPGPRVRLRRGRAWAGAITALLQGEAYAQSARMAARVGAYDGYEADREAQDRVVRMHRDAALDLPAEAAGQLRRAARRRRHGPRRRRRPRPVGGAPGRRATATPRSA